MNRRTTLGLTVGLLGAGVSALGVVESCCAQGSDVQKIKGTLDDFSAALDALDIRKMEDCWVHDDRTTFIGPRDKTITTGWDAVKRKLEGIVAFWSELKHTTREGPHIYQNEETAWAYSIVINAGKPNTGASNPTPAFNAFILQKRGDRWLIVSASAWRVPQ